MICGKQRKFNAVSVFRKRSCFRTNGLFHRHIKGARSLKTRLLLSRSSGKRDQLQSHIRHFRFIPARGIRAKAAAACKSRAVISSGRKRPLAQIQRVTSGSPQSCLASSPSFSSHCEKPIRFVFRKKFSL